MFYVYEYYKKENDEVFYVGKGTGNRMYELHNRSKYFMSVYRKYKCDVRIVYDGLTNEAACEKEIERIAEMKSIGQAYCNFTFGGTGFSTGKLNPIHKRLARGEKSLFAKRKFFGADNGFYGRKHSGETKKKISESRKGKGGQFGEDNPMYGVQRFGEDNPMFGKTGDQHHNSVMYNVTYTDGTEERLTAKQCELKFGIAFTRIRGIGGKLHYKKKTKNDIYEGATVTLD
ncbi:NUMOD3 domain-containing DNA-binding protein [Sporosarcina sp. SAFN-015]|uniref:NUMOD3 domain-containing DNA-binding protein n=1 Tax=Sporosarcina sp. SAFN-015 TaxID=3387274 RepID=UPI003F817C7D